MSLKQTTLIYLFTGNREMLLDSLDNMAIPPLTRQESMRSSDVTSDTTEDDVEHIDSEIGDISTADLFIIKSSFDSKSVI